MNFESKTVTCEYCKGNTVIPENTLTSNGATETINVPCPGCENTGLMEIRKYKNHADWESICLNCEGKGFNDSWDHQHEKHETIECADCNATGGITYLESVAS